MAIIDRGVGGWVSAPQKINIEISLKNIISK